MVMFSQGSSSILHEMDVGKQGGLSTEICSWGRAGADIRLLVRSIQSKHAGPILRATAIGCPWACLCRHWQDRSVLFTLVRVLYVVYLSLGHPTYVEELGGAGDASASCVWFMVLFALCICPSFTLRQHDAHWAFQLSMSYPGILLNSLSIDDASLSGSYLRFHAMF